ncbi:RelE-like HigB toxin of type II HigAB toxin-antitoxin system [Cecembia calidifontis]|uniref:RelE-like HigB toxin of type II HigAB toxin-antitoxin system n=2 Tax=Cecembia calidifontis TaxID=1187080 RepID=A0A4V2F6H8_9BACT|nr:RelE-like HigB toxin of type II HigAB toxin-antitoxin system [Cecembia calidifontis]
MKGCAVTARDAIPGEISISGFQFIFSPFLKKCREIIELISRICKFVLKYGSKSNDLYTLMRIITFKRIQEFSEKHADAEIPLRFWYSAVSKKDWASLNDIKKDFNNVDYVGNHRFVFNTVLNKI